MINGIDVSHWQGDIDWDQVNANDEIKFVFIKASEGLGWVDDRFVRNWKACLKPKAPYHFWRYAVDGKAQARHFYDVVTAIAGETKVRPIVDLEDPAAVQKGNIFSNLKEFELETRTRFNGRTVICYTGAWWWNAWVDSDLFGSSPLWIAHYTTAAQPLLPKNGGWQTWALWQYSSSGKLPGIAGNVDLNRFIGTEEGIQDLLYFDEPTPPPPPPGEKVRVDISAPRDRIDFVIKEV